MSKLPQIDGYSLNGLLGAGGMGLVYGGQRTSDERPVAIKFIKESGDSETFFKFTNRLRREVEISKKFSHPYVVQILDMGFQKGDKLPFIVMEYLEGQSLEELLMKRALRPAEAKQIGRQMAEALSYIHAHGVIHRDVKPSNIHIVSSDRAVLLDFGLALAGDMTRLTKTDECVGTLVAMAPEQLAGRETKESTDIYGLGFSLYYALTLRPPFTTEQIVFMATTGEAIKRPPSPAELVEGFPTKLSETIMDCLAYDPLERIANGEALLARLNDEPVADGTEEISLPFEWQKEEQQRGSVQSARSIRSWAALLSILILVIALLAHHFVNRGMKRHVVPTFDSSELHLLCSDLSKSDGMPEEGDLEVIGQILKLRSQSTRGLASPNGGLASPAAEGLLHLVHWCDENERRKRAALLLVHFVKQHGDQLIPDVKFVDWSIETCWLGGNSAELAERFYQWSFRKQDSGRQYSLLAAAARCFAITFKERSNERELMIEQGLDVKVRKMTTLLEELASKDRRWTSEKLATRLQLIYLMDKQANRKLVKELMAHWQKDSKKDEQSFEPYFWASACLERNRKHNAASKADSEKAVEYLKQALKDLPQRDKRRNLVWLSLAELFMTLDNQEEMAKALKRLKPAELPRHYKERYLDAVGSSLKKYSLSDTLFGGKR